MPTKHTSDNQSPKVEVLPIEQGATPDQNNVNKHTQRGGGLLENSLRKRGAFRSIASAGKDTEIPVVYAGNYTLEKAIDAGFTEIVNVHVKGNQLVNVVRDDIEPGSPEAVALGIEDNEISKQSYNPDVDVLAALAAGDNALLSDLQDNDAFFGEMIGEMMPGYENEHHDEDDNATILDQAVQLKPSSEYLVIMCENPEEWERLKSLFSLPFVRRGGYKRGSVFDSVGIQRVITFQSLLEVLNANRHPK